MKNCVQKQFWNSSTLLVKQLLDTMIWSQNGSRYHICPPISDQGKSVTQNYLLPGLLGWRQWYLSLVCIDIHPHSSSDFRVKLQFSNIFSCFPNLWKRNDSLVHIPIDEWKFRQEDNKTNTGANIRDIYLYKASFQIQYRISILCNIKKIAVRISFNGLRCVFWSDFNRMLRIMIGISITIQKVLK